MPLFVENALVVTMDDADHEPFAGHLVVDDAGEIARVGPGPAPSGRGERIDAGGKIVMPGFVSAHSHLWQSAFPGIAADSTADEWAQRMYGAMVAEFGVADLYELTRRGAARHLCAGITTAFNFTVTPGGLPAIDRCQANAAIADGLRVVHGFSAGQFRVGYGFPESRGRLTQLLEWSTSLDERLLAVAIAGVGVYWEDGGVQAKADADLMREFGLRNQLHYLESPATVAVETRRWDWLQESGTLGPDLTFGHFVHPDDRIADEAVARGVSMAWNPMSNGRLGSGTPPIPALLGRGMRIGLGVDGEASSDRTDPFENMRSGLYQVRARERSARALSASSVLRMHTLGAAEAIGVDDRVGSLSRGKKADFLFLRPRALDPRARSALHDALVLAYGLDDIESVFVGGKRMVSRGRLVAPFPSPATSEMDA